MLDAMLDAISGIPSSQPRLPANFPSVMPVDLKYAYQYVSAQYLVCGKET